MKYSFSGIEFEWAGGELRYFCLNGAEIVRRIYFTVRYAGWETAIGTVIDSRVLESRDRAVTLEAKVRFSAPGVDYEANVELRISVEDGINYSVKGNSVGPNDSTDIRRCGIAVLLGAREQALIAYELQSFGAPSVHGVFTDLVESGVKFGPFSSMQTSTSNGQCLSIDFVGTEFGLEDQRPWNDNSWKLFSALPHKYPILQNTDRAQASVHISFGKTPAVASAVASQVKDQELWRSSRVPNIHISNQAVENNFFSLKEEEALNKEVTWGFTPLVNLDDDQVAMENAPSILDQVRTLRSWHQYPDLVAINIDPISLDPLSYRPGGENLSKSAMAPAFAVALTKYLSLARIANATFRGFSSAAQMAIETLAEHASNEIEDIEMICQPKESLTGFLILNSPQDEIWLVNLKGNPATFILNLNGREISQTLDLDQDGEWTSSILGGNSQATMGPYLVRRLILKSIPNSSH